MFPPRTYPGVTQGGKLQGMKKARITRETEKKEPFLARRKCTWDVHCFKLALHVSTIVMGPLEIAGNQDAPPGSPWDGDISTRTEMCC